MAKKQDSTDTAVQQLKIKIKGPDHRVVDNSARQIIDTALRYGGEVSGPIPLPTEVKRYTVLRSTFVHKDAREQFEMRIHKRLIIIKDPSSELIESLSKISLPAGVDVEIKI